LARRASWIGLGTGAGTKTRILLEELRDPVAYVPVDNLEGAAGAIPHDVSKAFSGLEILPVCAIICNRHVCRHQRRSPSRKVVYFPGSTIGNFEP